MSRREYPLGLNVNGRLISRVIIDPHYQRRHGSYMNDWTIIKLVQTLNNTYIAPESESGAYQYFVSDCSLDQGRHYRLVWLLEQHENYIGVINAYRRR